MKPIIGLLLVDLVFDDGVHHLVPLFFDSISLDREWRGMLSMHTHVPE